MSKDGLPLNPYAPTPTEGKADMTNDQTEWSVLLEYAAPEGAEALAVDDPRFDELVEHVEHRDGAVSGGGDRYGVRLFVDADDALMAAMAARDILFKAVANTGLPEWPCVRIDVMTEPELDAQLARPTFPKLLGSAELAVHLGITRQRLAELRRRPEFPKPMVELAAGPIWLEDAVLAFEQQWDRRPGRRAARHDRLVGPLATHQ